MFHGYVRFPESKLFSRKNIIIWVKFHKASGNFIRQQKKHIIYRPILGDLPCIYHASPRPNRETPLKVQCTISQVSSFPSWSLQVFSGTGIFEGQSYHLGHLLTHWGFLGKSCSLKMSLFQNPQLLFSGYSCLVNAFQSFWVVLLLVDLLVWMGCIKNMARPLHGDRM